ncbi:MAG: hypothetical protein HOW73_06250 [Polyangiaceae bacterium]|nr:hypothetical protein [Polyangiaceae bacterium]
MLFKTLKGGARLAWSVATCVLASSGLRIDNLSRYTLVTLALGAVGYGAHHAIVADVAESGRIWLVYAYFAALFVTRYVYLFTSFGRGGIADTLIHWFGEERGYRIYEIGTAWMFFQRGLTFAPLVALHPWSLLSFAESTPVAHASLKTFCVVAGAALALLGFVVNTASTLVVGFDVYYYKDLFLRRAVGTFEVRGPYRYWSNPMYGIGQCSGYGAALMLGSVDGLAATLVNQLFMYGFYYLVEKPHITAVFGSQAPPASEPAPANVIALPTRARPIDVAVAD